MTKSRDEFGRTIERSVFDEQIGEAVETTSLEVGGVMDSRSGGHKKFDGIRRPTETDAFKSRGR